MRKYNCFPYFEEVGKETNSERGTPLPKILQLMNGRLELNLYSRIPGCVRLRQLCHTVDWKGQHKAERPLRRPLQPSR
jgi:hypothetical protein